MTTYKYKTDTFSWDHCGHWKDGSFPKCDRVIAIVHWDMKHDQYIIRREEIEDFKQWVVLVWSTESVDLHRIETEEGDEAFFEEVDLRFYEIQSGELIEMA